MSITKKEVSNDVTSYLQEKTKADKRAYGKYGTIVNAINENTRQLQILIDEIKRVKANE